MDDILATWMKLLTTVNNIGSLYYNVCDLPKYMCVKSHINAIIISDGGAQETFRFINKFYYIKYNIVKIKTGYFNKTWLQ